jgi:DNA-binding XRE family transcriptional regulator
MNVQIIEKDGQPEWAVIPYAQYEQLVEAMELLEDVRAFDEAKMRIAAGEELVPSHITYAILDGANPIRVWRDYRGFTQQQLADKAGISKPYLSQLESGKRAGTTEVLSAIALALEVTLEELVD